MFPGDNTYSLYLLKCMYFLLGCAGACCYPWAFSGCGEWALLWLLCTGFCGAPLIAYHRLYSLGFRSCGTQLSCPKGCGIFLNLGLNWCPLHWQGILKTAGPPGKLLARGLSLTTPIPTMCMLDAQSVLS